MNVGFTGIVREVKDWDTDKNGVALPKDKITSQILFMDRDSGGDVSLTYPVGHGLKVGQELKVDAFVKPVYRNFKLTLYVQVPPKK